ncbi:MAG: hypothetical protein ACYTGN_17610 [Planctomycetota bacterium]|jgi:hypothetical protein
MTRLLVGTLLVAASVLGKPGPDTATRATIVDPACNVAVRMEPRACPSPVVCDVALELPSPGYDLSKPVVQLDRERKRIRIELRATPKPGDRMWPAVMTPAKTTATLGVLRKGRYVVEIHYAVGKDRPLRVHHAFLLDAVR